MLRIWGSDNSSTRAIQLDVVVGLSVVQSHPLEGNAHKIRMDRIKSFAHIPSADTAAASALLHLFLEVYQVE
jgi:hypothetical protein